MIWRRNDKREQELNNRGTEVQSGKRVFDLFKIAVALTAMVVLLGLLAGMNSEIAAQGRATKELELLEQELQKRQSPASISPSAVDLQFTIEVSPTAYLRGEILTYTVRIVNEGDDTATNLFLVDTLPDATTYVSASASVSATRRVLGNSVIWDVAELVPGYQAKFFHQARVNADSTVNTIENSAWVLSDQTAPEESNVCTSALRLTYVYLPLVLKGWPPIPLVPVMNAIADRGFGTSGRNYTVSWQEDTGTGERRATYYTLQEDDDDTFVNILQERSPLGNTPLDYDNKPLGSYYYRVRACNNYGCSGWSDYQYIFVRPPTAPALSVASDDGNGNYTLSWSADPDWTQTYCLEESPDNFGAVTAYWCDPTTSKQFTGHDAGTYYYHVKGVSVLGEGSPSNVVSVQVTPPEPTGWTQLYPATTPRIEIGADGRAGHGLVYDSNRDVVVLFGGGNEGWATSETWEWDGNTWTRRYSANGLYPPPRRSFGMVYDAARGVTLVFGGFYEGDSLQRTHTLYGDRLVSLTPTPSFPEGFLHGIGPLTTQYRDLWQWDGVNWTQVSFNDPYPGTRSHFGAAYDSARQEMIIVGGFKGNDIDGSYKDGTWIWNGTIWYKRDSWTGQRHSHAMAYDPVRGVTVLFGGYYNYDDANTFYNDTWEWDGTSWTQRSAGGTTGAFPSKRRGAVMFYSHRRGKMILFGGYAPFYNDMWEWDPTTTTWSQISDSPIPSPRMASAVAYDATSNTTARTPVVLYSGFSGGETFPDDTWEYR